MCIRDRVKGAFPERALDHAGRARIDQAYLDAAAIMLSPAAREAGFLPVFGTHDDRLAGAIMTLARERGWAPQAFEFEMLYGVRPDWQLALRQLGYAVRVYLPFGQDWWPSVSYTHLDVYKRQVLPSSARRKKPRSGLRKKSFRG